MDLFWALLFVLALVGALVIVLPDDKSFLDKVDRVIAARDQFSARLELLTMREEEILGIDAEFEKVYDAKADAENQAFLESGMPRCEICGEVHCFSGPYCSAECAEKGAAEVIAILRDQFEAYYNAGNTKRICSCGAELEIGRCECWDCELYGRLAAHEEGKKKFQNKGEQRQWGDAI